MTIPHLADSAMLLGFATTLLVALWSKVKLLADRMLGILFVRVEVQHGLVEIMTAYLWHSFPYWRPSRLRYATQPWYVRPKKRVQQVGFQILGEDPILFWNGWRPLLANVTTGQKEHNAGRMVISFIRGTWSADAVILAALDRWVTEHQSGNTAGRYEVHAVCGRVKTPNGESAIRLGSGGERLVSCPDIGHGSARILHYHWNDLGSESGDQSQAFSALSFDAQVLEAVADVDHWKRSEAWYRERRIPWKRGLLLDGPPGNGKTSLARAIGQTFDMPVFSIDLATMDNRDLRKEWSTIRSNAPCIALLEDIDAVFHGRENVTEGTEKLTFDCLLNTVDGMESNDGILLIVTTNHIDKVDPAILRPGRVDRCIRIDNPDRSSRYKIARRILSHCQDRIEEVVNETDGVSGAELQERCRKLALDHYWSQRTTF